MLARRPLYREAKDSSPPALRASARNDRAPRAAHRFAGGRNTTGRAKGDLPSVHRGMGQGYRQRLEPASDRWRGGPSRSRTAPGCLCRNGLECTGTRCASMVGVPSTVAVTRCDAPEPSSAAAVVPLRGRRPRESPWPFGSRRVPPRHTSTPWTRACFWISPDSPVTSWRSISGALAAALSCWS